MLGIVILRGKVLLATIIGIGLGIGMGLGVCVLSVADVRADDLIPPPGKRSPIFAGELHISLVLPFDDSRLCPSGTACVYGTGASVGASFQRRWRRGIGLGIGYELGLHDGGGVHELTVVQSLRGIFQYAALPNRWVHPLFRISAGPALFGDSFSVDVFGGVAEFQLGAEFELSDTSAAIAAFGWSVLRTGGFKSPRDGVNRAQKHSFDSAATLQVGYVFYGSP